MAFNFRDITFVPPTPTCNLNWRSSVLKSLRRLPLFSWLGARSECQGYRGTSKIYNRIDNILFGRCVLEDYIPTIFVDDNDYIYHHV